MIKLGSSGFFLNLTKFVQEVVGRYIIVMVSSVNKSFIVFLLHADSRESMH